MLQMAKDFVFHLYEWIKRSYKIDEAKDAWTIDHLKSIIWFWLAELRKCFRQNYRIDIFVVN